MVQQTPREPCSPPHEHQGEEHVNDGKGLRERRAREERSDDEVIGDRGRDPRAGDSQPDQRQLVDARVAPVSPVQTADPEGKSLHAIAAMAKAARCVR